MPYRLLFSLGLMNSVSLTAKTVFDCFSRGGREGRVPCHVPPSDISTGPGSRLQRGSSWDHAGQKRQKSVHSTSLPDSQQASSQSNGSVWLCWRQAGGAQHRWARCETLHSIYNPVCELTFLKPKTKEIAEKLKSISLKPQQRWYREPCNAFWSCLTRQCWHAANIWKCLWSTD